MDYATVYISLQEVYKLSNVEEPATGFASRMGTAFSSGWKSFEMCIRDRYTVALDTTRSNRVVGITGIQDVLVNGESLGLGGYLDIGLIDTMKDLFVNFIGAVVFSVTGFFYAKSKGKKRTAAQSFVPRKKTEETDYLKQARDENRLENHDPPSPT